MESVKEESEANMADTPQLPPLLPLPVFDECEEQEKLDVSRPRARPTKPSTPNSSCSDLSSMDDSKEGEHSTPQPTDHSPDIHAVAAPLTDALTTQIKPTRQISASLPSILASETMIDQYSPHPSDESTHFSIGASSKRLLKMTVDFKVEWTESNAEWIKVSAMCDCQSYCRRLTSKMIRQMGFPMDCSMQTLGEFLSYALHCCEQSPGRNLRSERYGGSISMSYQRFEKDGILEVEITHDLILQVKRYVIRLKKISELMIDDNNAEEQNDHNVYRSLPSTIKDHPSRTSKRIRILKNELSSSSRPSRKADHTQSPILSSKRTGSSMSDAGTVNHHATNKRRKRRRKKKPSNNIDQGISEEKSRKMDEFLASLDGRSTLSECGSKVKNTHPNASSSLASSSSSSKMIPNDVNHAASDNIEAQTQRYLAKLVKEVSSLKKKLRDTERVRLREEREFRRDIEQLKLAVQGLTIGMHQHQQQHRHELEAAAAAAVASHSAAGLSEGSSAPRHSLNHSDTSTIIKKKKMSQHRRMMRMKQQHQHPPLYLKERDSRERSEGCEPDPSLPDEVMVPSSASAASGEYTSSSQSKSGLCDRCKCDMIDRSASLLPGLAPMMSNSMPIVPLPPGSSAATDSLAMSAAAAAAAAAVSAGLPTTTIPVPPAPPALSANAVSPSTPVGGLTSSSYSSLPASVGNTLLSDPVCYSCGCLLSAHLGGFCPGQF